MTETLQEARTGTARPLSCCVPRRAGPVDRAKQFIAVNHRGQLIGDAILVHLADDSFNLVGYPMVLD